MRSRPIHFRNEINKIVILNLENINVSPAAPSTRSLYMACARAPYTRKGTSPAPVQLSDDAVAMGRARHPNRLMGLQLSVAAVTASCLAELRSFCPVASRGVSGNRGKQACGAQCRLPAAG